MGAYTDGSPRADKWEDPCSEHLLPVPVSSTLIYYSSCLCEQLELQAQLIAQSVGVRGVGTSSDSTVQIGTHRPEQEGPFTAVQNLLCSQSDSSSRIAYRDNRCDD